ncbi:MAG TPA: maleylpyruvate isomerase N-terminal domain-containing protein [Acidimicrobiales bacterium]|nr:maleylpyruvate isomerase N-terminal domain-containing protein [Acidimicrobiales bacterium]
MTKPMEWLEGARASHASLVEDLGDFDDKAARGPSLLPGWTRGHVLTHLARNADSNTAIFLAAQQGEVGVQYPGGRDQRANDIEAGSGRTAAELAIDVEAAIGRLEAAWDSTPDDVWETGRGRSPDGTDNSLAEWVFSRWRETEVHHADLGMGYTWARWPSAYVREDLRRATMAYRAHQPMGQGELPPGALGLVPNERLAWLLGRHWPDGLYEAPRWI